MTEIAAQRSGDRFLPLVLNLRTRTVLVTGAAGGIGRATALCLAALGANLTLVDLLPLQSTEDACLKLGAQCTCIQGDLSDSGFMEHVVAHGPFYAAACVAGVLGRRPGMDDDEAISYILDVNLRAPMKLAKACAEQMASMGEGFIVMVGSGAGRNGGSGTRDDYDYATYAASKGGIHTVVRWLSRRMVCSNVLVNGVAPGPILTSMSKGLVPSAFAPGSLPMNRLGTPEEVGWPIALLLTPAAGFISGAVVDVNGGAFVG